MLVRSALKASARLVGGLEGFGGGDAGSINLLSIFFFSGEMHIENQIKHIDLSILHSLPRIFRRSFTVGILCIVDRLSRGNMYTVVN